MDNIGRFEGMSPLSRQFLSRAADTMAAQINTVKSQDEVAPEDEAHDREIEDLAFLDASTTTPEEGLEAAQYGGELGEIADEMVEDDGEKVEEHGRRRGHEQADELKGKGHATVRADHAVDTDRERDTTRRGEDRIRQLQADVPEEIWAASASMIQGQMVGETPKVGLAQLKSIPEPGMLEMSHAGFAELMDITERKGGPLPAMVEG